MKKKVIEIIINKIINLFTLLNSNIGKGKTTLIKVIIPISRLANKINKIIMNCVFEVFLKILIIKCFRKFKNLI